MNEERRPSPRLLAVAVAAIVASHCSPRVPPAQPSDAAAAEEAWLPRVLPVEMTVGQRSTTEVPGTDGRLRLTIDDVTRNQVMTSMATREGVVALPACSMSPGHSERVRLGHSELVLTLKKLDNALLGKDFATFALTSAALADSSETAKIERLLQIVASLESATFVRNGEEHSSREAAEHLRAKWRAMAKEVSTAAQFIERVATRSSASGEAYQLRLANGQVLPLGDYLGDQLAELERAKG